MCLSRPFAGAAVVSVIPTEDLLVSVRVVRLEPAEGPQIGQRRPPACPVAGAIEDRGVVEQPGLVEHRREGPRRRLRAVGGAVGIGVMLMAVLRQPEAQA